MKAIINEGIVRKPILVDNKSYTILDGHHRHRALQALGARWAPILAVDYRSDIVELKLWRQGVSVTKQDVLQAAASGILFPPKTTRHILKIQPPLVNMPIRRLLDLEQVHVARLLEDEKI